MSWKDANEINIAGTGEIFVAPVGTTLPVNPTSTPHASFIGLGFTSEDGVTFTVGGEVGDFRAWQSRQPIRRERNSQDASAAFELLQWNETNVPFAFGGGAVTSPSAGIYRYELPLAGDALDERAMIIDWQDGDRHQRVIIPRGTVSEDVSPQLQRTEMAVLPITFSALAPEDGSTSMIYLTDDAAAFVAGS